MKNLKLTIAALTIIFAVMVSNANESAVKQQTTLQTEFVTPNCQEIPLDSEKIICTNNILPTVSDIEMREEYNILHEESDALLDFNTNDYLPEDFNAYNEDKSNLVAHELLNEEADATFDFNTADYLPLNFYASK